MDQSQDQESRFHEFPRLWSFTFFTFKTFKSCQNFPSSTSFSICLIFNRLISWSFSAIIFSKSPHLFLNSSISHSQIVKSSSSQSFSHSNLTYCFDLSLSLFSNASSRSYIDSICSLSYCSTQICYQISFSYLITICSKSWVSWADHLISFCFGGWRDWMMSNELWM